MRASSKRRRQQARDFRRRTSLAREFADSCHAAGGCVAVVTIVIDRADSIAQIPIFDLARAHFSPDTNRRRSAFWFDCVPSRTPRRCHGSTALRDDAWFGPCAGSAQRTQ
jgi:hypothetical protein